MVDRPPTPPAGATAPASAPPGASATKARAAPAAAPPVQAVEESFVVPEGTLLVVRLSADVSSATAHVEDRVHSSIRISQPAGAWLHRAARKSTASRGAHSGAAK